MALDGAYLRHICFEINEKAQQDRIEKVYQPNKDELVLLLRGKSGAKKLLISVRANSPRINFTNFAPENPKVPPMFCMLLRKRLAGAKLRGGVQPAMERALFLVFDATNDFGDPITLYLIVEIMGKHSNVIFAESTASITEESNLPKGAGVTKTLNQYDVLNSEKNIIDSLKRVDMSMSSQRLVLPGLQYKYPPVQDKLNLLENEASAITKRILSCSADKYLNKALLDNVQGISPIVCREVEYRALSGKELFVKEMTTEDIIALEIELERLTKIIKECGGKPHMAIVNGKPMDFTFFDILQYKAAANIKENDSFSELLDVFYHERDAVERIKVKSQDLHKLLNNTVERLSRKINNQKAEISRCENREPLRIKGDLLQANLYRVEKGAEKIVVENFYDDNKPITIKLNPAISPSQNAQKYYKDYRKAKTAQQVLQVQIENAKEELEYITTVMDVMSRVTTENELNEIRLELTEQGYIKNRKTKQKQSKEKTLPPLKFTTKTGFEILVGRNNKQNDKLTLKQANKNDLWFHTKEIPGSHTILLTQGEEPDDESVLYAAKLAAFHSKAKESSQVPVDYTKVRYVSKPQGAKPGRVIYVNNKTLYVTPSGKQED